MGKVCIRYLIAIFGIYIGGLGLILALYYKFKREFQDIAKIASSTSCAKSATTDAILEQKFKCDPLRKSELGNYLVVEREYEEGKGSDNSINESLIYFSNAKDYKFMIDEYDLWEGKYGEVYDLKLKKNSSCGH